MRRSRPRALVREARAAPPQVLMVERAEGMAFRAAVPGFSGGRIDQAGLELAAHAGVQAAALANPRESSRNRRFEWARRLPDGRPARAWPRTGRWEPVPLAGVKLERDALTPFARWVPKFHVVRRFDTLFFVAEMAARRVQ